MDDVMEYHGVVTGRFPPSRLNFGRTTNTVHPVKYMVAAGGLTEGFQFYGPFKDVAEADVWASKNLKVGTSCRVYPIFDTRNDP